MEKNKILYKIAMTVFFAMAIISIWHQLAPSYYHFLTEMGAKLWAIAGLCLYGIILLERHKRD